MCVCLNYNLYLFGFVDFYFRVEISMQRGHRPREKRSGRYMSVHHQLRGPDISTVAGRTTRPGI